MILTIDSNAEAAKPTRGKKANAPVAQATGNATRRPRRKKDGPPAKSSDSSLTKASFYLPVEVVEKLTIASISRRRHMSDLVSDVLLREFSGCYFHDPMNPRSSKQAATKTEATPPADSTPPDTEIDRTGAD